jgi:hypothetical protein
LKASILPLVLPSIASVGAALVARQFFGLNSPAKALIGAAFAFLAFWGVMVGLGGSFRVRQY